MTQADVDYYQQQHREITVAVTGDELLGPLGLLPGIWVNEDLDNPKGWNMIALPFVAPDSRLDYRLLLNQFREKLTFRLVDKGVPNRGLDDAHTTQTDQVITALDYEQTVEQVQVEDRPASTVTGSLPAAIHHEPGLFLNMLNETADGPTIARLATIPHGDAALALGTAFTVDGPPRIPAVDGRPIGVDPTLPDPDDPEAGGNRYLEPYGFYHKHPFRGLFDPVEPHLLLDLANRGRNIVRTTVLSLDTDPAPGGIRNIPFVVKQADAVSMTSIFWINEFAETDANGDPLLELQYLQIVMLDFFPRRDGVAGLISWPHVSINTMVRQSPEPAPVEYMTTS